MKRILLPFVSLLTALALPGCLQQATTVHLNKDGSGTIVEETTFGAQMAAMLGGLGGGLGGEGAEAKDPIKELASMDKAKARAAKLGEGVTVEKAEVIEVNGNKGARVTYHFADINKLQFTTSGDLGVALPEAPGSPAADKPVEKPTTFKYADGVLTLTSPEQKKPDAGDKKPEGDAPADEAQAAQMEAMMTQMMGDMKMSLKLVIEPGIAESNATYVDGNTITLMEMDMGKVLKTPGAMKKLKGVDKNDQAAAMAALKGVDGIKAEAKKEITVKVK